MQISFFGWLVKRKRDSKLEGSAQSSAAGLKVKEDTWKLWAGNEFWKQKQKQSDCGRRPRAPDEYCSPGQYLEFVPVDFYSEHPAKPLNFWPEVQGLRDFRMINRVCVVFNQWICSNIFFRAVIGNKYRHRHARRGKNWDRRMSDMGWDQCGSGNCFTFCGFTDSLYTLGGIGVSKVSFIHDAST